MSDVDCLIVLTDDAPSEYVTAVRTACARLARRHLEDPDAAPNRLERVVDRSTGMFRSGFVTTERAVRTGQFPAVFDTSGLAPFIAPWRTVLYSVFDSAETIAGEPIDPDWATVGHPLDHQVGELLRNWLMTTLLASVQVPYRLVSGRAVLYSLEAFKWTAYNCAFHYRERRPDSLEAALAVVPVGSWYTDRFRWARASNAASLALLVVTPLVIAVVHARTLTNVVRS